MATLGKMLQIGNGKYRGLSTPLRFGRDDVALKWGEMTVQPLHFVNARMDALPHDHGGLLHFGQQLLRRC